jgi:hypothetical protein
MIKKALTSCLVFFILLIVACNNADEHKDTGDNTVYIDIQKNLPEAIEFKDFIQDAHLIRLESSDRILIGSITKILHFKGQFYIHDTKSQKIHIFKEDGQFISSIGKIGRGPDEILDIYDFDIDRKSGILHLLSLNSKAVQQYDYNGNYISTLNTGFQSFRIAAFSGEETAAFFINYFDPEPYNLRIVSQDSGIINLFPFPQGMFPMFFSFTGGLKSMISGQVLYSDVASPKIYEIKSNGETILRYEFDLGSEIWPEERRYEFNEFFQALASFKLDFLGSKYLDTENILYFDFMDNNSYKDVFYLKKDSKLYIRKSNLTDDPFSKLITSPSGLTEDERFISVISPTKILSPDIKALNLDKKYKDILLELDQISPDDNPLLLLYKVSI